MWLCNPCVYDLYRHLKSEAARKVLETEGAPTTVRPYYLCTDCGARKHAHARGVWEHAPPEKFLKLGALRSLLRPYLYSSLYLDSMPLEYWARVLLEHHSPCLHGSRSLVVTCRGYQCQMWALQSIGTKQQKFKTEVN